jgi:putative DNA primase/helicase
VSGAIIFTPCEIASYFALRVPRLRQTRGPEWRGPCPVHRGEDDNFAVDSKTGRWFCHSGCQRGGDILLLERELTGAQFKEARDAVFRIVGRNMSGDSVGAWRKVAEYLYVDEAGAPLYRVVRRERGAGVDREKKFHVQRFEGDKWINGLGAIPPVPYHLSQVLEADHVFICEGEKDADTLATWGFVGTTCPFGAGKWSSAYSQHFNNKQAIILVDNDDPGRSHAAEVARDLFSTAASVRVIDLPNVPTKGDVTDWKNAGHTREELLELVNHTQALTSEDLDRLTSRWILQPTKSPSKTEEPKPNLSPFRVSDEGVFLVKENSGTLETIRLAARVDVIAKTRDSSGANWGRLLNWHDEEGREHQWAMPMELLASDAGAVRARLLSEGLPFITPNNRLRERFAEYLQTIPIEAYARCVARVGWHGNAFVLPDQVITSGGNEKILYQTLHESVHHWNTGGDIDQWIENVGRKCSGNSRLIISVACGFAGPLLSAIGAESGGVHFYGGTSTGKSTALIVGGSVCGGGGQAGFTQTWRFTLNGLEAVAEAHNDGTLFLDELSQVDPRDAAETAYLLGNGQGKARMNRNMGARKKLNWTLLFVSAGETTLADHVATTGKRTRGGAEVRLLNIHADAGRGLGLFENLHGTASPDRFAREMKDAALRYYGTPFRFFVERLIRDRPEVEQEVKAVRESFVTRFVAPGASGELKRAAERFALIGAAGELATEWGLTGWRAGEAIEAVERCFAEWVKGRGTMGSSDVEAAIRRLRVLIQTSGASRFQRLNPPCKQAEPERVNNRAGFKRVSDDGETEYLILPEVFKSEVCEGCNHQAVLKELDIREFLQRDGPNMTIKPRLPELGSVRVYCIRDTILNGDES